MGGRSRKSPKKAHDIKHTSSWRGYEIFFNDSVKNELEGSLSRTLEHLWARRVHRRFPDNFLLVIAGVGLSVPLYCLFHCSPSFCLSEFPFELSSNAFLMISFCFSFLYYICNARIFVVFLTIDIYRRFYASTHLFHCRQLQAPKRLRLMDNEQFRCIFPTHTERDNNNNSNNN